VTTTDLLFSKLSADLPSLSASRRLTQCAEATSGRIVFTTSFGLEDQALTHLLAEAGLVQGARPKVEIVTLDTGRLFAETYELWAETEARYGVSIRAFTPKTADVEAYVASEGINGFRQSVEARHQCCQIRKMEPLSRALAGATVWLTGLRAEQSPHRAATPLVERDLARGLVKLNPLVEWTRERLVDFIALERIPYNPLHDSGFASIGCAPCTRAIKLGEAERAGRWWWEDQSARECGLHVKDKAA
jgi:phosphoadenosine phosphosulfate reductase